MPDNYYTAEELDAPRSEEEAREEWEYDEYYWGEYRRRRRKTKQ